MKGDGQPCLQMLQVVLVLLDTCTLHAGKALKLPSA